MLAIPDEHNRNKDAEMDTRKTGTYHIRNVIIREETHIKPIHTFLTKKIFHSSGMYSGEMMTT